MDNHAVLPALEQAIRELIESNREDQYQRQGPVLALGTAEGKRDALVELGDVAYAVAGGLRALAGQSRNRALMATVQYSRTALTEGSSNALWPAARGLSSGGGEPRLTRTAWDNEGEARRVDVQTQSL